MLPCETCWANACGHTRRALARLLQSCKYHCPSLRAVHPGFELENLSWKELWKYPRNYTCCMWNPFTEWGPVIFLAVKAVIALVWLYNVLWSWSAWSPLPYFKWWAYLSHQSAFMELVYLAMTAFTTGMAIFSGVPDRVHPTPWFVRVTWLLGDAVPCVALMVSLMFWAPILLTGGNGLVVDDLAYALHIGNTVIVLLDALVSRRPVYMSHAYVPLLYAVFYVAFTYLYYLAGGTDANGNPYIYNFLDWSGDGVHLAGMGPRRLVELLCFIGVPVLYAAFVILVDLSLLYTDRSARHSCWSFITGQRWFRL